MAVGFCSEALVILSRETYLVIKNNRYSPVCSITVRNVDSFDFEAGSGPIEKFRGAFIPARRNERHRLELNHWATKCPVTMDLHFSDGNIATFTINMKYAVDDSVKRFSCNAPFVMNHTKMGNTLIVTAEL